MMLTDREWLRMVSFALVAGAVLGATYTGALFLRGHAPAWAIAAGIVGPGILAILVHVTLRYVLDRQIDAALDSSDEPTDDAADTQTDD